MEKGGALRGGYGWLYNPNKRLLMSYKPSCYRRGSIGQGFHTPAADRNSVNLLWVPEHSQFEGNGKRTS